MIKKNCLSLLLCLLFNQLFAQSTFVPIGSDFQFLIERYEIKRGKFTKNLHSSTKPYSRQNVAHFADSIWKTPSLSKMDKYNILNILNDNSEWADTLENKSRKPIFKKLYKHKADLYETDASNFNFHINPIFNFSACRETASDTLNYLNSRGIEFRGIIGKRIGFYSYVAENQAFFPRYVRHQTAEWNAVANEGFWKTTDVTGNRKDIGVDFLTAKGYMTFDIVRGMSVQFGHDKHFIGNGYRSLFLSDFSSNYLFLKLNAQIGRFQYSNLYTQLTADVLRANQLFPKKYATFHHLSINLTDNFNIGLFEGVLFARQDSLQRTDKFELGYLNPIIFYRFVEQQFGSVDNTIIGLDFRYNWQKSLQFYGQIVLDEFVLSQVRAGKGWNGNKQAVQLGLKYIDVANIQNLDLQLEANIVRPYTYSHDKFLTNYSNFKQPLAHPLGANFYEFLGILRYQPLPKWFFQLKTFYIKQGQDIDNQSNVGSNIFLLTPPSSFGNRIGQGVSTQTILVDMTTSYQWKHNLFVDFKIMFRRQESDVIQRNTQTTLASIGLRLNMAQRRYEF